MMSWFVMCVAWLLTVCVGSSVNGEEDDVALSALLHF